MTPTVRGHTTLFRIFDWEHGTLSFEFASEDVIIDVVDAKGELVSFALPNPEWERLVSDAAVVRHITQRAMTAQIPAQDDTPNAQVSDITDVDVPEPEWLADEEPE